MDQNLYCDIRFFMKLAQFCKREKVTPIQHIYLLLWILISGVQILCDIFPQLNVLQIFGVKISISLIKYDHYIVGINSNYYFKS